MHNRCGRTKPSRESTRKHPEDGSRLRLIAFWCLLEASPTVVLTRSRLHACSLFQPPQECVC